MPSSRMLALLAAVYEVDPVFLLLDDSFRHKVVAATLQCNQGTLIHVGKLVGVEE